MTIPFHPIESRLYRRVRRVLAVLLSLILGAMVCGPAYLDAADRPGAPDTLRGESAKRPGTERPAPNNLTPSGEPKEIRVLFNRYPAVQMIGFLVAKQQCFYENAGLPPVEFFWNRGMIWSPDSLYSGEIQFAYSMFAQTCVRLANGEPFVVVSLVVPESTFGFLYREDCVPNARSLKDFNGRRVGYAHHEKASFSVLTGLLNMTVNPYPLLHSGANLLEPNGLDAICIHSYECPPITMYTKYRNVVRFMPFADEGCSLPEDCILCTRDFVRRNPDMTRRFVLATWEGLRFARDHKKQAIDTLGRYCSEIGIYFDPRLAFDELNEFFKAVRFTASEE